MNVSNFFVYIENFKGEFNWRLVCGCGCVWGRVLKDIMCHCCSSDGVQDYICLGWWIALEPSCLKFSLQKYSTKLSCNLLIIGINEQK